MNIEISGPVKALFSSDKKLYHSIRNIFGFYPGNIALYKLAFRHKSAAKEVINGVKVSNERMEYLGDAVLSSAVADFLFKKFPYKDEGFLTQMRSKIVSRAQLNKLSKKLGLDRFVELDHDIKGQCKSVNGDAFEAFIGAVYLDKGYNFTRRLIINRIIGVHFDIDELEKIDHNFKSKLIEWSQREKEVVDFAVVDEIGDGFNKQYKVEITVNDKTLSTGQDYSIKGAEQIAAEKACNILFKDSD